MKATTSLTPEDLASVPSAVVARLRRARHVLAVCHEHPEADALGAVVALRDALGQLGVDVTPVCADPVPPVYAFMPGIERVRLVPDPATAYDLLVVVDCGELERVGPLLASHGALFRTVPILSIDHHRSNVGFGEVTWVDADAAATCEMLTLLVRVLGVSFATGGGALAANLLAGIVMDTATFQHPNVTPRTLRAAAELVAEGAPLAETSRRIYRTKPETQLRLFGRVLERLASELDGQILWSDLLEADLVETGASVAESEGIIDLLSQSEQAAIALLFKEQADETRVSIRTRESVDATELAGIFGGGGHVRAAGATVALSIDRARPAVLAAARKLIPDGTSPGSHASLPESGAVAPHRGSSTAP
jgi:bifunctional oligoribonuclease and PAP phosphatase NrnA